mmetsp:Transcript_27525/g.33424  ORF Transcript_27525/g.33424 Transcript_27525/m.33424 type:complete len:151 (+) Transcript_27525:51-503(+)
MILISKFIEIPVGQLYKKLTTDPGGNHPSFGYFPLMAGCSEGQVGGKIAESFIERVISVANLILTEGNTLLDDDELEMMTILRINREFMRYMRANHPRVAKQQHERSLCGPVTKAITEGRRKTGGGRTFGARNKVNKITLYSSKRIEESK